MNTPASVSSVPASLAAKAATKAANLAAGRAKANALSHAVIVYDADSPTGWRVHVSGIRRAAAVKKAEGMQAVMAKSFQHPQTGIYAMAVPNETAAEHEAPAPVVASVPAEPFIAPAPAGRVVSVCNEHVLNEWARMATQAYKAGHNEIGHKFSAAATISPDTRVCPKWFDSMQDVYRSWLVFGWTDAVPAFQKAFPAVSA